MSAFDDLPATVPVPDLVGLNYDEATSLKRSRGVHIADPDPDAPPISNYWWEHKYLVVLTQSPPAGSGIDRHESVTVTLGLPGTAVGARAPRPRPPALSARAESGGMDDQEPPVG